MKQKNPMTYWSQSLFALTLVSASISTHQLPAIPSEEILSAQADKSMFSHQMPERCEGPRHQRVSVRYTTPEGIGFSSGIVLKNGRRWRAALHYNDSRQCHDSCTRIELPSNHKYSG
jgi:hypothetical protein